MLVYVTKGDNSIKHFAIQMTALITEQLQWIPPDYFIFHFFQIVCLFQPDHLFPLPLFFV